MFESVEYRVQGVAPLILHNGQTADPLNQWAKKMKQVSGKRKKTDEDYENLAKIEWHAGLYCDDKDRVIMPAMNLTSLLIEGAKKLRLGKQFQAGVFVEEAALIEYDGPKDLEKLWLDANFRLSVIVRIKNNRIVRCRPYFKEWGMKFTVKYFPDQVDKSQIDDVLYAASFSVGMGDWRPRFGRFAIVK